MAEGTIIIYNAFKEDIQLGVHDLAVAQDEISVTLHTAYTPDIDAHQLFADTGVSSTEYTTANGYTVGGKQLTNQAVVPNDSTDLAYFNADDAVWTALGTLSPATPSDAIIANTGTVVKTDPLIGYVELGVKATNGGDYTVSWNALGIFEIT